MKYVNAKDVLPDRDCTVGGCECQKDRILS